MKLDAIQGFHRQRPSERCREARSPRHHGWVDRSPLAGVIFELRGVLVDDAAWRLWLLKLVTRMGLRTHYRAFYRIWDLEFQSRRAELGYWPTLRAFLLAAGLHRPQIEEIEAAARAKLRTLEEAARTLPGVPGVLEELSGLGLRLAAVSYDSPAELSKVVSRLGLAGRFDFLSAGEDRLACFQAASHAMGIPRDRLAYVGSLPEDLAKSHRAGLLTVGFNLESGTGADLIVEQLQDLPAELPLARSQPLAA